MHKRTGESEQYWVRSDRIVLANNKWYFLTREFTQEGPFDNKKEAENELFLYIRCETDEFLRKKNEHTH